MERSVNFVSSNKMADSEFDAIRAKRLAELQAQAGGVRYGAGILCSVGFIGITNNFFLIGFS